MSDKIARTHTHGSNRAKAKDEAETKVVFKSVLSNPFRIQWPSVPLNVQNSVLAMTISALIGVADYQLSSRKRKRQEQRDPKRKKMKRNDPGIITSPSEEPENQGRVPESKPGPVILQNIVTGINEVTKRLETQVRNARITHVASEGSVSDSRTSPELGLILACRADIDPPMLLDHLPHLVAAYNSTNPVQKLKLVPLPKGAEVPLAQALGIRRAAVIGFEIGVSELSALDHHLQMIPTLTATWLAPATKPLFEPTHIKQVRTTAPKDMRAAKERRSRAKRAVKERRKLRISLEKTTT